MRESDGKDSLSKPSVALPGEAVGGWTTVGAIS